MADSGSGDLEEEKLELVGAMKGGGVEMVISVPVPLPLNMVWGWHVVMGCVLQACK